MTDKIVVLTTCSSEEEARRVALRLVEARLAACAAVTPGVTSFYHWKGSLEESREWSLTLKTSRDRFDALVRELQRIHSYEVPEIVALPILDGSHAYLEWIDRELGHKP
jgi:periplasmic divalent cation tolerance protein